MLDMDEDETCRSFGTCICGGSGALPITLITGFGLAVGIDGALGLTIGSAGALLPGLREGAEGGATGCKGGGALCGLSDVGSAK